MKSLINLLLLILLCVLLGGCAVGPGNKSSSPVPSVQAQPAPTPAPTPTTKPMLTASSKLLGIWRDWSASESEDEIEQTAPAIVAAIKEHHFQITGARVVRFANGNHSIFAEIGKDFVWGEAPANEDCKPDLEKAPAEAKLFKDAKERYIQSETRRCQEGRVKDE